jgi:hypothetical protein
MICRSLRQRRIKKPLERRKNTLPARKNSGSMKETKGSHMPAWPLLIEPISALLDKLIPDPDARAKAQGELLKSEREAELEALRLALQADSAQTQINAGEAAHEALFVAGWRPFIGWVCGVAFAYHFVAQPFLAFAIAATSGKAPALPQFDMETLTTVLMGMLGLGSLRTLEKIRAGAPHKIGLKL